MDDHENLERDHPIAGLVQALGEGAHAGAHVGRGVAGEIHYLGHMPLRRWLLVVSCGLDYGDVEVGDGAAAAADLGEPDAGLVLDHANGSADRAWSHGRPEIRLKSVGLVL